MKIPNDLINEFLRALNHKIPGIHIEEYNPPYGSNSESIKFRAVMSNVYCQNIFNPSKVFYDTANAFGKIYFGIEDFEFNNTGNIFWFWPEDKK